MMRVSKRFFKYLLISALAIPLVLASMGSIPITGVDVQKSDIYSDPVAYVPDSGASASPAETTVDNAALQQFISEVEDGAAGVVRGIYVQDMMEFPVVQQPSGQAGYVSQKQNVVTEFAMSRKYGVTGILAHNYLAGQAFFDLETGDIIQVVYGDGSTQSYQVADVLEYQALSPNSATSSFVDLDSGATLSASQLFKSVYSGSGHLTLQTCIQKGSEDSWGRLFVIADPIE
jgi:hypothetical protein